uniref:Uncharacterized protein n=1 Tax=Oryza nivara TaxID=4536 RepID=A0A0E0FRJ8_ORYNI
MEGRVAPGICAGFVANKQLLLPVIRLAATARRDQDCHFQMLGSILYQIAVEPAQENMGRRIPNLKNASATSEAAAAASRHPMAEWLHRFLHGRQWEVLFGSNEKKGTLHETSLIIYISLKNGEDLQTVEAAVYKITLHVKHS